MKNNLQHYYIYLNLFYHKKNKKKYIKIYFKIDLIYLKEHYYFIVNF